LDKLLWQLLQIGALPDLAPSEPNSGQVGHEEIQEAAASGELPGGTPGYFRTGRWA
jgi:hypothetical protein